MKRKLCLILVFILLCCSLASCDFLFPSDTGGEGSKEALFDELISTANVSPTKAIFFYTVEYDDPGVTLDGSVTFTHGSDGASLYLYEVETLLSAAEAIEEGASTKELSGWIYSPPEGAALSLSSEVKPEWLDDGGGEFVFHSLSLKRNLLSSFDAKATEGGYSLHAVLRPDAIASALPDDAPAMTAFSYTLLFDESKKPISAIIEAETEAGGEIRLTVTLSYNRETVIRPGGAS